MKNEDVAIDFVNGSTESKTENMFIEGNAIYSYGYHFPIAVRLRDDTKGWNSWFYLFNEDGYSNSTSRQKSLVKGHIGEFKEVDTKYLKDVISKGIKTVKELVVEFGLSLGGSN